MKHSKKTYSGLLKTMFCCQHYSLFATKFCIVYGLLIHLQRTNQCLTLYNWSSTCKILQGFSTLCLSPLKPSLVRGISCERVPVVDLSRASRVFLWVHLVFVPHQSHSPSLRSSCRGTRGSGIIHLIIASDWPLE